MATELETRPREQRERRMERAIPSAPHRTGWHRFHVTHGRRAQRRIAALPRQSARIQEQMERPNVALAGLELLLGYEWLVSGVDKLLFGAFPQQLGALLKGAVTSGRLPGAFAALLQGIAAPHAAVVGGVVEVGETLAGLAFIIAGLVVLLTPITRGRLTGRLAMVYRAASHFLAALLPVAAAGTVALGLSFYLLDGLPSLWFAPSIAYGGALDTGLLLAAGGVVVLIEALRGWRRVGSATQG